MLDSQTDIKSFRNFFFQKFSFHFVISIDKFFDSYQITLKNGPTVVVCVQGKHEL